MFAQGIVFVGAVTVGALAWRKWDHIFRGHGLESPVNGCDRHERDSTWEHGHNLRHVPLGHPALCNTGEGEAKRTSLKNHKTSHLSFNYVLLISDI